MCFRDWPYWWNEEISSVERIILWEAVADIFARCTPLEFSSQHINLAFLPTSSNKIYNKLFPFRYSASRGIPRVGSTERGRGRSLGGCSRQEAAPVTVQEGARRGGRQSTAPGRHPRLRHRGSRWVWSACTFSFPVTTYTRTIGNVTS